jgi:hypothetical protein
VSADYASGARSIDEGADEVGKRCCGEFGGVAPIKHDEGLSVRPVGVTPGAADLDANGVSVVVSNTSITSFTGGNTNTPGGRRGRSSVKRLTPGAPITGRLWMKQSVRLSRD